MKFFLSFFFYQALIFCHNNTQLSNIVHCIAIVLSGFIFLLFFSLTKLLLLLFLFYLLFFLPKHQVSPLLTTFFIFFLFNNTNLTCKKKCYLRKLVFINTSSIFGYNLGLFYFYPHSEYANIWASFVKNLS